VGGVATDIEDRPQPPEFDTVPDMVDDLESDEDLENAATAIVDNDDEDDENDDL